MDGLDAGSERRTPQENSLRTITIPQHVIERAAKGPIVGMALECAVSVNWPELRLTEDQIITNAAARASGQPEPYPDHSIFSICIPYAVPQETT